VTRSEFFLAVRDEFGDTQGRALVREMVLGASAIAALMRRSAMA